MAPKHHPTPLSGGVGRALNKELGKARAMANILASQSAEMRAKGAAWFWPAREPASIPQRRTGSVRPSRLEHSVTSTLLYMMVDDPNPFGPFPLGCPLMRFRLLPPCGCGTLSRAG